MNGKDVKSIVKTAVSLFLICAVSTAILAFVNGVTAPKIAENNEKTANEARLAVMPDADEFEEIDLSDDSCTGYIAYKQGSVEGYVFTTSAGSYGGAVEVMTGIKKDGTVSAISILTINDTPGLGMNAKKESWFGQFAGMDISGDELKVTKDGGEIDAISSATVTSRAVTGAVNQAAAFWKEVSGGQNNG